MNQLEKMEVQMPWVPVKQVIITYGPPGKGKKQGEVTSVEVKLQGNADPPGITEKSGPPTGVAVWGPASMSIQDTGSGCINLAGVLWCWD